MKKLIAVFSFLIFVLFTGQLFAQVTLSSGLRVGINSADMEFQYFYEDEEDVIFSKRTGIYVGIPLEIRFNETFALQPELNVIQKGIHVEYRNGGSDWRGEFAAGINLNYLELPVLAKLSVGTEKFRFHALAGPRISLTLDGKIIQDYEYYINDEFIDSGTVQLAIPIGGDAQDRPGANHFDLGLTLGLGASIKAGPGSVMVDARYDHGLSNWNYDPGDGEDELFHRGVAVTLGYLMPLGGN